MDPLQQQGWDEQPVLRALKIIIPVLLLALVLVRVGGIVSDYRAAESSDGGETASAAETTPAAEPADETTPAAEEPPAEPVDEPAEEEPAEEQPAEAYVVVTIDGLNFRDGPGTDTGVIGTLDEGSRLALVDSEESWYKVRAEDGTVGWVSSSPQFVSVEQAD